MTRTATIDEIRFWAMSLPEVTEKQHFRFHVPLWQVHGKTFLGMGRDQTTVVCCITEDAANKAVAADPEHLAAVRRMNAQRSFLGLEVRLRSVPAERVQAWIREAWARTHRGPSSPTRVTNHKQNRILIRMRPSARCGQPCRTNPASQRILDRALPLAGLAVRGEISDEQIAAGRSTGQLGRLTVNQLRPPPPPIYRRLP